MTITRLRKPKLSVVAPHPSLSLPEVFAYLDRHLELVTADTPRRVEQVYRLRHQVYCLEHDFEQASDQQSGRESDAWDARARHLLIRHRDSSLPLATARLILADEQDPSRGFPVEQHAGIDPRGFSASGLFLPRKSVAEVSRFAISRAARAQLRESGVIPVSISERDLSTWITLRLINGLVKLSQEHCVVHWYTMMEGSFIRLLRRMGMYFEPIGGPIEFHGRRFAALDAIAELMAGMRADKPHLYWLMVGAESASIALAA